VATVRSASEGTGEVPRILDRVNLEVSPSETSLSVVMVRVAGAVRSSSDSMVGRTLLL
jgi:uncharacterized lipoprotein